VGFNKVMNKSERDSNSNFVVTMMMVCVKRPSAPSLSAASVVEVATPLALVGEEGSIMHI
jgi:hypothetical protein